MVSHFKFTFEFVTIQFSFQKFVIMWLHEIHFGISVRHHTWIWWNRWWTTVGKYIGMVKWYFWIICIKTDSMFHSVLIPEILKNMRFLIFGIFQYSWATPHVLPHEIRLSVQFLRMWGTSWNQDFRKKRAYTKNI